MGTGLTLRSTVRQCGFQRTTAAVVAACCAEFNVANDLLQNVPQVDGIVNKIVLCGWFEIPVTSGRATSRDTSGNHAAAHQPLCQ